MSAAVSVDGKTRLYGILGHPVTSSLSPAMQNAAFAALGLNAVYVPFPVQPRQLPKVARGLAAAGVAGFNLTVPHKLAILPLLDEITPEARAIGAVNTVRCENGRMSGTNTDGEGFLLSLAHDLAWQPEGKRALLLGAGGAARGIAISLLEKGLAALHIANRTPEKAEALAADCRDLYPGAELRASGLEEAPDSAPHLLVNATTVGMGDGASPVELARVGVREALLDIVYTPPETPLLAQAAALDLPHANGMGMLLHQGWLAFRFWTEREAPLEVMRAALQEALARR
ncbi:MAG: shikimate dehydrogenase [SAR324 cluster bacterium]|nr:shikimate dehydrogenase [SAR324 cluster bacterium]